MSIENTLRSPEATNLILAGLLKRLERIETKLDRKVAYLSVEDAVEGYRRHLREGKSIRGRQYRKPANFDYLLSLFQKNFSGSNIAEITSDEIDIFVANNWAGAKSGTIKQRKIQLRVFFAWVILHLKKHGDAIFQNPCELLEPVAHQVERPEFIPVEKMKEFISSAPTFTHRIVFGILATAGLRISELLKLRKMDVSGRVLTLRYPKSGLKEETAVIPARIAAELRFYMRNHTEAQRVIPLAEKAVFNAVRNHGSSLGLDLNPHALRKWTASYWERKGEEGMVNFVLRHSSVNLRGRYVSPLTVEEVIGKLETLENELCPKAR
jgi:integrase